MSRPAEANLSVQIESTEDVLASVDLDFRLLTGNGAFRRHLLRNSARANARRKVALLFDDLDNFKSLNDTLGFHGGDFLLLEVARRLTACVREYDTIARVGRRRVCGRAGKSERTC